MENKTKTILTVLVIIFSGLVLWNLQMITHDVKENLSAYSHYAGQLPFITQMYVEWSMRRGVVAGAAFMVIFAVIFLTILILNKKMLIGLLSVLCLVLGLWTGLAHHAILLPL